MRRRRSRKGYQQKGMLGGARKTIKKGIGIVAVAAGASIALGTVITSAQAATANFTTLNQSTIGNIGPTIAANSGFQPGGQVDIGKFIQNVAVPILGGLLVLKGYKLLARSI